MQDYRVHIKHMDGSFEYVPYFCLPANDLNDVIAPSCYSCFDYPNALADLVGPFATSLFWSDQTSLCKLYSACSGPSEGALEANCILLFQPRTAMACSVISRLRFVCLRMHVI